MSLLRLLSTGKSLVSVRDSESRYRLTSQRLLPQFGPTKNPFSATGKAEPPPVSAVRQGLETGSVSPKGVTCNPGRAIWQQTDVLLRGWKSKLSGLLASPLGKPAKPAIPRFCKSPVQGELSLDRVKVVRNDLSDADLEVVTARSKSAPALVVVEPVGRPEGARARMTTRLFRVGKT